MRLRNPCAPMHSQMTHQLARALLQVRLSGTEFVHLMFLLFKCSLEALIEKEAFFLLAHIYIQFTCSRYAFAVYDECRRHASYFSFTRRHFLLLTFGGESLE